jgi:hypothetical protein
MGDERELYRCPLIKGECVLTDRRVIAINYYEKGIQQLPLREIRSIGVRSNVVLFGRTQHVVYFGVASNAVFGGYAPGDGSGLTSGVFCKSRKEADVLASKIQEAMLGLAF